MYARMTFGSLLLLLAVCSVGYGQLGTRLSRVTGLPTNYNLPPAHRLMHPGPGVAGPGPGVLPPPGMFGGHQAPKAPAQVLFMKPDSMQIRWDVGGVGRYDSQPLIVPGRQDFPQGGRYYLKLTDIEDREGVELYPTLEVGTTTPRTAAYLDHNAIPIQLTNEDFDQVLSGNFVTKVIYLPDPEFQELALAGVDTLVSTRLDPGVDPIVEADRRGAILAIIRMGNKDREMPAANGVGGGAGVEAAAHLGMRMSAPMPYGSGPAARSYVSGVNTPQYGLTMSGTPIALPGPPHLPLGAPAGLQSHTMRNHTHMHLPSPTSNIWMHVKQTPGFAYPAPANKVFVRESLLHPNHFNRQPAQLVPYHRHGHGHAGNCGCQGCSQGQTHGQEGNGAAGGGEAAVGEAN